MRYRIGIIFRTFIEIVPVKGEYMFKKYVLYTNIFNNKINNPSFVNFMFVVKLPSLRCITNKSYKAFY